MSAARSAQEGQRFAKGAGAPDWTVFPALALWFICLQLAALMSSADQANLPRQRLVFVFFMFCQLIFALLFSLWRRKGEDAKARRVFSVFLTLGIPACIAAHVSFAYGLWPILGFLPTIVAAAFLPLLYTAFAASTPPDRQGTYLGISTAAGAFVWSALLPLLPNVYEAGAQGSAQLAHLHIVQAVVQTVMCGLLIRLLRKRPELFAAAPPDNAAGPGRSGLRLLFPLFFAEAVFFLLAGCALGTAFPATIPEQRPSLYTPVFFLALPLAIGFLLDKNRHGVRLVAAFLVVCALVISLAPLHIDESGFFLSLFHIERSSILLLFWFIVLRLAGGSPFFPLLATLVMSLNGLSPLGMRLAQVVPPDATGYAAPLVSGSLALCFAALVACMCSRLQGEALTAPQRKADTQEEDSAPDNGDAAKTRAFASSFSFTRRESEIMEGITCGCGMEEIGKALGISERTARLHLTGILKKTGMPSRQRLEIFFSGWERQ